MIYLDHGATTPVRPEVIDAMLPFWTEAYGNPSSHHAAGGRAAAGLDEARQTVASLLHAAADEVIFTGNGSESDNLALRGVFQAARARGEVGHLIISSIEHSAVAATARQLQAQHGCEVTVVPVDSYGRVAPTAVAAAIRPDTALISIMAANNEVGTMQPVAEIGAIARAAAACCSTPTPSRPSPCAWDMQAHAHRPDEHRPAQILRPQRHRHVVRAGRD